MDLTSALNELSLERDAYLSALLAPLTEQAYGYDWAMFCSWARLVGRCPLPATEETVALYLAGVLAEGRKVATAVRRASSIASRHRAAGYPSPVSAQIRALLRGARRARREQPEQMKPLTVRHLRQISRRLKSIGTPLAIRDRAILVVGFASALRRGSLCELDLADIEIDRRGVIIHLRREKQDQEGRGRLIGLPWGKHPSTCPVRCLQAWMKLRGRQPGPLFTRLDSRKLVEGPRMRGEAIGRMVQRSVALIGLEPSRYCGHSLRSGLITAAAEAGANDLLIARHSGHRSLDVLRGYVRRAELFRVNVCALLDL